MFENYDIDTKVRVHLKDHVAWLNGYLVYCGGQRDFDAVVKIDQDGAKYLRGLSFPCDIRDCDFSDDCLLIDKIELVGNMLTGVLSTDDIANDIAEYFNKVGDDYRKDVLSCIINDNISQYHIFDRRMDIKAMLSYMPEISKTIIYPYSSDDNPHDRDDGDYALNDKRKLPYHYKQSI